LNLAAAMRGFVVPTACLDVCRALLTWPSSRQLALSIYRCRAAQVGGRRQLPRASAIERYSCRGSRDSSVPPVQSSGSGAGRSTVCRQRVVRRYGATVRTPPSSTSREPRRPGAGAQRACAAPAAAARDRLVHIGVATVHRRCLKGTYRHKPGGYYSLSCAITVQY
jgi:hypothetical protein